MTPAERLRALGLVARTVCVGPPERPKTAWQKAAEVALAEGLGGALWAAVRDLPPGVVPPATGAALRAAHRSALGRNLLLRRQLDEVLAVLAAAGVEPVPLKGALYLLDGTLPDLGVREMGDLDVAVAPEAFDRSVAALCRAGYRPAPGRPFAHPHELPFTGGLAPVELHAVLGSPPIPAVVPLDAALSRAERRGNWARLCADDVVAHHVLHTQVQDRNHAFFGLSLRQLHTAALVLRARGGELDWDALRNRFREAGLEPVLDAWLALCRDLGGLAVPPPRIPASRWRARAVLGVAALGGWPTDVARNLSFALGRAYLDERYGHGGRPLKLALARCRHVVRLAAADWRLAVRSTLVRRR